MLVSTEYAAHVMVVHVRSWRRPVCSDCGGRCRRLALSSKLARVTDRLWRETLLSERLARCVRAAVGEMSHAGIDVPLEFLSALVEHEEARRD